MAPVYFTVFVLSALGSLSFYILLSGVALQDDLLLALCSFSHLLLPDRMLMPGWRRSRCISSDFFESQAAPLSPPLAAVPWWMSPLASACGACGTRCMRPRPTRRPAGSRQARAQSRGRGRNQDRRKPAASRKLAPSGHEGLGSQRRPRTASEVAVRSCNP